MTRAKQRRKLERRKRGGRLLVERYISGRVGFLVGLRVAVQHILLARGPRPYAKRTLREQKRRKAWFDERRAR